MYIIFLVIIIVNKWEEVNFIRNVMFFYDWRKVSIVKLYNCIFRSNICIILKLIIMKDKVGWKINLIYKEFLKNFNNFFLRNLI